MANSRLTGGACLAVWFQNQRRQKVKAITPPSAFFHNAGASPSAAILVSACRCAAVYRGSWIGWRRRAACVGRPHARLRLTADGLTAISSACVVPEPAPLLNYIIGMAFIASGVALATASGC